MKPIENLYKKNDVVRELPFLFFSCGNSFKYSSGLGIFGDANMTLVSCDPSCIQLILHQITRFWYQFIHLTFSRDMCII